MLTDFREEDAPLRCEGAIVGSGAAGLSLARQLLADGRSVLMLECGGTAYTAAAAALNDGRNVGGPYHDLEDARLRFFGGTAAILGGRCAELDATDFERREWLARSGWPFPKAAPTRWYDAARATLDLTSPVARGDAESLGFDSRDTALLHWQFDDRSDRLGFAGNQDLIRYPRLRGLLNATVTEVLLDPHATTAAGLCIATLDARLGHVEGRKPRARRRRSRESAALGRASAYARTTRARPVVCTVGAHVHSGYEGVCSSAALPGEGPG